MGGCEVAIVDSRPDLVSPWLHLICRQNCRLLTSLPSQWEESGLCPASQSPSSQGWCIPGWAVGRTVSQMTDGFFCLLCERFQNLMILVKALRQGGEEVIGTPGSTVYWPLILSQERDCGPLNPVCRHIMSGKAHAWWGTSALPLSAGVSVPDDGWGMPHVETFLRKGHQLSFVNTCRAGCEDLKDLVNPQGVSSFEDVSFLLESCSVLGSVLYTFYFL